MKVLEQPKEFGGMIVLVKSEDKIPVPDFDDESDDNGTTHLQGGNGGHDISKVHHNNGSANGLDFDSVLLCGL